MPDTPPPAAGKGATVKLPMIGTVPRRTVAIGAATVAVIVLGAYLYRARKKPTTVSADAATGTATGGAYVNPAPSRTVASAVNDTGQPVTDADWMNLVLPKLVSASWDAQYAILTLGKYLAGDPLDQTEANLVKAAWALQGKPPSNREIVFATGGSTPGTNTPPPPPPPPPPSGGIQETIYTFKSGDTLGKVAALYGMTADELYNWNTNPASLEQYAHEHGYSSSNHGSLIWPGYQIGIPIR